MSSFGNTLRIVCDITKCVVEVNENKRSCDQDIDAIFKLYDKFKNDKNNMQNNNINKASHIKCDKIECKTIVCDNIKIKNKNIITK